MNKRQVRAEALREHQVRVRYEKVYDCSCGESFWSKFEADIHRTAEAGRAQEERGNG